MEKTNKRVRWKKNERKAEVTLQITEIKKNAVNNKVQRTRNNQVS